MGINMAQKEELLQQLIDAFGGDLETIEKELNLYKKKQRSEKNKQAVSNRQVLVRLQNVSRHYKRGKHVVTALQDVTLPIYEGEIVALIGPSGSGKSTVLNVMSGLDTPTEGEIVVDGVNITKLSHNQRAKYRSTKLGFVFQFFYLQPFLNVQTNVEVPAMFAGISKAERAVRSEELIEAVGLSDRLKHRPKELSGGQMQRAAIARALLNRPKLLLADEPTGNLDSENAKDVVALFKKVRDTYGTTVVIVTHDHTIADQADRIIELKDGKVVE
jgi:putative ABC transport system ATP-binding protein